MPLANLLDRAAGGGRLTFDEGVESTREADLHELGAAAHARRMPCIRPRRRDLRRRHDDQLHQRLQRALHVLRLLPARASRRRIYDVARPVLERVKYAVDKGATQIMIQGGVNPELGSRGLRRSSIVSAASIPADIHSLSVSEIVGLSHVEEHLDARRSRETQRRRHEIAAGRRGRILVERVRKRISARKVKPTNGSA